MSDSGEGRWTIKAAIDEANRGLKEGGIPIGSVLVHDAEIMDGMNHCK